MHQLSVVEAMIWIKIMRVLLSAPFPWHCRLLGRRSLPAVAAMVLFTLLNFSACVSDEADFCGQLASRVRLSETAGLLPPETREAIFYCGGLQEAIGDLDHLDRDLLLGRAINKRDFIVFSGGHTETSPPIAYADLADPETLKAFHGFVQSLVKR